MSFGMMGVKWNLIFCLMPGCTFKITRNFQEELERMCERQGEKQRKVSLNEEEKREAIDISPSNAVEGEISPSTAENDRVVGQFVETLSAILCRKIKAVEEERANSLIFGERGKKNA